MLADGDEVFRQLVCWRGRVEPISKLDILLRVGEGRVAPLSYGRGERLSSLYVAQASPGLYDVATLWFEPPNTIGL